MTDKMREEFEKSPRFRGMDFTRSATHPEFYDSPYANGAWDGWKASREALVIELPAENPLGTGPGDCGDGRPSFEQHCAAECNFILRDCREAIEAAGLKVKS